MTHVEVVALSGRAADLHARDPFPCDRITVIEYRVTRPAVILGSRQQDSLVDRARCEQLGLDVVRRRSGGGAVFLHPDEALWIDIVVPRGTLAVGDDVRESMLWAGTKWRLAIENALSAPAKGGRTETVHADYSVHNGAMIETPWSDLVCFAGIGPGEVLQDGLKCVGLSQRRTREGLRIQGLAYWSAPTQDELDVFVGPVPDVSLPSLGVLARSSPIANDLVNAIHLASS